MIIGTVHAPLECRIPAVFTRHPSNIPEETWVAALEDLGRERQAQQDRAEAAEARADVLAASLDEAHAARHGTIDKLNAAVIARKAAEAECARLRARVDEATERFRELCDRVGDFKTAYTGEEGWRIIPDMLAAMEDELVAARAFLAAEDS